MVTNFVSQELVDIEAGFVKRKRRTYSDDFKCELVQKCRHPHTSIASVALEHGINTNLLNRWVKNASIESDISNVEPVSNFIAIPINRDADWREEAEERLCLGLCHDTVQFDSSGRV
ncbi:transposase [Acinetobacter ursingii]